MAPVTAHPGTHTLPRRTRGTLVLAAGLIAFATALTCYVVYMVIHPYHWTLFPVDLSVYQAGGLIVRHVSPPFNPHLAAPLYDWPGWPGLGFRFTYTPFAAVAFSVVSFIPSSVLPRLSVGVNIVFLITALWFTFRGLGYRRDRVRLGATLLAAGAVLWTEPVIRTLYLGQVNLALMALIIWDLTQPDTRATRWWKGAGVGIAAGIKLVPLIFLPYLVLTRRFRQAGLEVAGFAATVIAGFVLLPRDSALYWWHGLFFQGTRTGFVGWAGNQSLRGLITRLSGSVAAAKPLWLVAAVVTGVIGLLCAAALHRAGHTMVGLLTCALTGLLISPISWDHHWVWIAPGIAVAGHYAVQAALGPQRHRWRAAGYGVLAVGMCALYGAWPGSLWSEPTDLGTFSLGLIWAPPNSSTSPGTRVHPEYYWHGLQLLTGNAFLLWGLLTMVILLVVAPVAVQGHRPVGVRAGRPLAEGPG